VVYRDPAKLDVIPLTAYDTTDGKQHVERRDRLSRRRREPRRGRRVTHPEEPGHAGLRPPITRSLAIGGTLDAVAYAGLGVSGLDTLAPLSFAAFPRAPQPPRPVPVPIEGRQDRVTRLRIAGWTTR
jgi:hypothetical protein